MIVELAAFRERWRILLEKPGREDLALELAAPFERDLDEAREALLSVVLSTRGAAIGRLVRGALILEFIRERRRYVLGPYARELRARVSQSPERESDQDDEGASEEELEVTPAEPEAPDPYLAWTLGELAECAPEAARPLLVDRAIEAFDAIALTPISPGNDLGPFTQLAHLMNESQVHRALAVTERMALADWSFTGDYGSHEDLSRAREYLTARLAELGRLDAAEALLRTITDGASRAEAIGRVQGHRIVQRGEWLSPLSEPLLREGQRFLDLLRGLTHVLEVPAHPPPEELLRDCVARVRAESNAETRTGALVLMEGWFSVGPAERWFSAIEDCAVGWLAVDALFHLAKLVEASDSGPRVVKRAIERMLELPDRNHIRWLDSIYSVREAIPFRDALALFANVIATTARSSRALLIQELHFNYDLEALLRWLGGEDAVRATAEALDEVERLLG